DKKDDKKNEVDAAELKKFAGSWTVTGHEHGGAKTPAKKLASLALTIDGAKTTFKDGDEVREASKVVALDPSAKPATLDFEITSGDDKGKVVTAIYKFDGDKLTVCFAEPGKDRPKGFAGQSGTGHTLLQLARKKK